jgi:hypothetical protein
LSFGQENPLVTFQKIEQSPKIDGVLDSVWLPISTLDNFHKSQPLDSGYAQSKTEVKIAYDNKFFYVFATCHLSKKGKYVVQSLKRDFSYPRTDAFVVFIDPYSDGINGFSFACNPYGAQREGLLELGGQGGVTTSWDNKWYSATQKTDSVWTVEMAIPFNSLRFNADVRKWKINFSRNDLIINEISTYVAVPRNFNVANLAFTTDLIWSEDPPKSGKNISLIPYVTASINQGVLKANVGGDAKIGITSSLNLDLTVNPDFSTVEVDVQQTNLDRFELFFPERRQFFIENSDLFGSLGGASTRPFFSRRIGIAKDEKGNSIAQPILGGARLSGKLNNKWRLGLMTIQTGNGENNALLPSNFSIFSVQRKLFKRSTIGGFYIDKEVFSPKGDYLAKNAVRIAGSEMNFNSWNSKWQGKAYYHSSLDSNKKVGVSQGSEIHYSTKFLSLNLNQELVNKDFNSEVGFIRRKNYFYLKPSAEYLIYPKNKTFIYHDFGAGSQLYIGLDGKPLDNSYYGFYKSQRKTTAIMQLTYTFSDLTLVNDFDPTSSGGLKLKAASRYTWNSVNYQYIGNERKNFFTDTKVSFGQYFNGSRFSFSGSLRYRIVPKFVFSLNYSYDKIDLPKPYSSVDWVLLGPQTEILFTTKLFWTTYIQYNQQLKNININSRLQWRFKPASDIFLVYTDNYLPDNFKNKSRGIVVKFTYWFNL